MTLSSKSAYGELAFNFKNDSSVSLAFRSEARRILLYNDFNDKSASFDIDG